jgi:hypothetical protein
MWICLNKAFLSIVTPSSLDTANSEFLLVRARRKGDIEAVFGDVMKAEGIKVMKNAQRDYLFRALIPRAWVTTVIAEQLSKINYSNFKNSVVNKPLHDAYASVWGIMSKLQPSAPYSGFQKTTVSYGDQKVIGIGRNRRFSGI